MCPGIGILTFCFPTRSEFEQTCFGTVRTHVPASVVVDFEGLQFSDSNSALGVVTVHLRSCTFFCLRRVLHLRWPVHFHVSSWWRGCVPVHLCFSGMGYYFLEYVITDTWNHAITPGPSWRSWGDGNVASSSWMSLVPFPRGLRARCSECPHRCVQFPVPVRKCGRSVSFNAQPLWE